MVAIGRLLTCTLQIGKVGGDVSTDRVAGARQRRIVGWLATGRDGHLQERRLRTHGPHSRNAYDQVGPRKRGWDSRRGFLVVSRAPNQRYPLTRSCEFDRQNVSPESVPAWSPLITTHRTLESVFVVYNQLHVYRNRSWGGGRYRITESFRTGHQAANGTWSGTLRSCCALPAAVVARGR